MQNQTELTPGSIAIHTPTMTRVEIIGTTQNCYIGAIIGLDDIAKGGHITAPCAEFVASEPARLVVANAAVSDAENLLSMMGITALEIVNILHNKVWPAHMIEDRHFIIESESGDDWCDMETGETLKFSTRAKADAYGQENDVHDLGYCIMERIELRISIERESHS